MRNWFWRALHSTVLTTRLVGGFALLVVALLGAGRAEAQQETPLEITVAGGPFVPLPSPQR